MEITIGSLCSGIGGLELGIERAVPGARVIWQVERDPFCRRVLAKHWPGACRDVDDLQRAERLWATCRGDTFTTGRLAPCDVICAGWPCQDLSVAGKGAGLNGARSSLWFDVLRVVRSLRPRVVVLENVTAFLRRGVDVVLGALAACGYDAIWDCIPAAAVGAPHRRDRFYLVAWRVSDANGAALQFRAERKDAYEADSEDAEHLCVGAWPPPSNDLHALGAVPVEVEPQICRVADGLSVAMDRDRRRALGNAVVPQVAEVVGAVVREIL